MTVLGDAIAKCVLDTFAKLPAKAKPRSYANGACEWVPLSGIVFGKASSQSVGNNEVGAGHGEALTCVSVGTGMRCLPSVKVPLAQGRCLHDWHAEIVALRAFNYFLLEECNALAVSGSLASDFLRFRQAEELSTECFQRFAIRSDVKIYMYCSEAPCGDASMELIMAAQDDATPWNRPEDATGGGMLGRGFFSDLGVVRRKPARGDAPETLSKSCTDKLAMRQCTSLLSSLTSLLICPSNAYISKVVLPTSQHVRSATARAFGGSGRMSALTATGQGMGWSGGYAFRPFEVIETSKEFAHSRRALPQGTKTVGSNITAMWTPQRQEVLINGSIQGNKQFSIRGSSVTSKLSMWKAVLGLSLNLSLEAVLASLQSATYAGVKASSLLDNRDKVKQDVRKLALHNWVRNGGGDGFGLERESSMTGTRRV